jgi:hypothetical protein
MFLVEMMKTYVAEDKSKGKEEKCSLHMNLVVRLRMGGAIPPLSHSSSWSGA